MNAEPQTATETAQDTGEDPKLWDIKADKLLRVALDEHLQELKQLTPSRERAITITKLQECIMWLGMDLKRLGGPNPYPHSYDPTSPVVDPTSDVQL